MTPKILTTKLTLGIALALSLTACQSLQSPSTPTKTKQTTQATPQTTTKAPSPYVQTQLDNGLNVIVKQDNRSPIALTQVWYKVGSNDEPVGKRGMSHFLEHMMFKDNAHLSRVQYNQMIAKFGGRNNAFTSNSHTAYYELFPANYYPLAMQMESFRMQDLRLKDSEVATEKEVIKEERRLRTDDDPIAKAYEEFLAIAQPDSPKSRPVIGSMADIEGLTTEDLQAWYDAWYAPNNATLVVVGDVKPDEVIAHAKTYFGDKKAINLPKRELPRQQSHRGHVHANTHQNVKQPTLLMAFNVPTITTAKPVEQAYALSLFADLIDGSKSSHFEKVLVREKQLFSSIDVNYNMFDRGDDLFFIEAVPREGVDLDTARDAILQLMSDVANQPIADADLQRSRTSLLSSLTFVQDQIATQAQLIGALANMDLPVDSYDKLPQELSKISKTQIAQTAKTYITKDNMTTMYVLPQSK